MFPNGAPMFHFLSYYRRGRSGAAVWKRGRRHSAARHGGIGLGAGSSREGGCHVSPSNRFSALVQCWTARNYPVARAEDLWMEFNLLFSLLSFINQVSLRKLQYIFLYSQVNLPCPSPNKKSSTQNRSGILFQVANLIPTTASNHWLNIRSFKVFSFF